MTKRRIWAFLIDMLFISIILGMLQEITFLNPYYDKYLETSDETFLIMEDMMNDNKVDQDRLLNNLYDLNYYSKYDLIIKVVVYIGYFGIFTYFNKGQTLGKKLMKIKVVNKDDTRVSFKNLFIREIILFGLYADILNLLLLNLSNHNTYLISNIIISSLASDITLIAYILAIFKKDKLGLHDILSKTKVVHE